MEQSEFEDIAKHIWQKANCTALSMSISGDEAEDIAQETMLKLWTLRGDISDATHAERLACCMARHMAIDCHRRKRTVTIDDARGVIDEKAPHPETSAEDNENMAWLKKRLAELPPTEYQILRLRQVEMKTYDEIAEALGIRPTSVSTLLARARAKLLKDIRERRI